MSSNFHQGDAADFSDIGGGGGSKPAAQGASGAAASAAAAGSNLFSSMWQGAQKVAHDVGAGGVLDSMQKKVTLMKAQNLGEKLEMIEKPPEVEDAITHIQESGKKYRDLVVTLIERADAHAKSTPPLRKAGAALIRCAGISDKVARDMAAGGEQGFYKETPTYQADLNEALLVSSAALLYKADRLQELYTTGQNLDASRANFEQGSYSTKFYVKKEAFGPGQIVDGIKILRDLVNNEVSAGEVAVRRYQELRLELSFRKSEGKKETAVTETERAQLASLREDVLSANRLLLQAKTQNVPKSLERLLSAELVMHLQAVKSLESSLAALPNTPVVVSGGQHV